MDLVLVGRADSGKINVLNKAGHFTIGNETALCTLALSDSRVSRKHAEISLDLNGTVAIVGPSSGEISWL